MRAALEFNAAILYEAVCEFYNAEPLGRQSSQVPLGGIFEAGDVINVAAHTAARHIWYGNIESVWPPDAIAPQFKRGLKAGHLWAQAELSNG